MGDNRRTGGQVLVDQLRLHGADLCFGVPGESYLAVLDAMIDAEPLRYVICRQESGVAMMAEAYGKLTGRPGIAMVTRGPGATNAAAGIHIAHQDSTPMILFVGQIERAARERETFQELDYKAVFGSMTKWTAEIDDAARIPEFVHRAFMTATAGRPGPVVLALPEDMLTDRTDAPDAMPYRPVQLHPGAGDVARLRAMLAKAERPVVIVGGSGWTPDGCADLTRFVEANRLPVAAAFRRQDLIDNDHPSYAGDIAISPNPDLQEAIRTSDLLIVLGTRLGEMTTQGFTLLDVPKPAMPMIHVHPDPEELGRVYQADLSIAASMPAMAAALAAIEPVDPGPWAARTDAMHGSYLAWRQPIELPGALKLGDVMTHLNASLPSDAIITNGAGNYAVWPARHYVFHGLRTQLAPTSGSMGYGLPAAVAAAIMYPDRQIVCFAGDGCFQMTMQEFGTAVQAGVKNLVVLLCNNGMYGTIRMHQEREYPTRLSGTAIVNPDYASLARAYGAFGRKVTKSADFAQAFAEATAFDGPAILELVLDPEALTPRTTLSKIRSDALAAGR